jgi:hypothetical protein
MEVRRLRADEANALRELRLRAMNDAPWAFGSTYARELTHGPDWWEARVRQDGDVLCVVADGDALAGMAGGFYPGERNPLDSDPSLETIVMTRSP